MKKVILLVILFFSFFQTSFACMPFFPNELLIWTFEWVENRVHPDKSFREWRNIQFIKVSDVKKPLDNYWEIGKYYFLHSDNNDVDFDVNKYKKWDQVIMISNYNNWNYEDYFAVYQIGKLIRKKNEELDIVDTQWNFKDWWKSLWQCWNYKPDDVMDKKDLLYQVAYFIDVGVPFDKNSLTSSVVYSSNSSIVYYISWAYFIDQFIQWKWEEYIWIWLILQVLVFVIYGFILYFLIRFFTKWKVSKKLIIPIIIFLVIIVLAYLLLGVRL